MRFLFQRTRGLTGCDRQRIGEPVAWQARRRWILVLQVNEVVRKTRQSDKELQHCASIENARTRERFR